jgi:hypothetical protein
MTDEKDLAIGVQVSAQVGPNRNIAMTLGVPLDWGLHEINKQVDRLMAIADRQNNIGLLEAHRLALENAEKDILTAREHKADYLQKADTEWIARNRNGKLKLTESQRGQIQNWETNEKNLRDNVIPRLQSQIAELEQKIGG